jgi:hypothetical protein
MRTIAEVEANVEAASTAADPAALAEMSPLLEPIRGATWPSGRG